MARRSTPGFSSPSITSTCAAARRSAGVVWRSSSRRESARVWAAVTIRGFGRCLKRRPRILSTRRAIGATLAAAARAPAVPPPPDDEPVPPSTKPATSKTAISPTITTSPVGAFTLTPSQVRLRAMAAAKYPLQGKTVLITGAARGIGADAARRAAQRGARVALIGLEPDELAAVAADCGPDSLWFEADVTDRAALESPIGTTAEQAGGIDVVIANAGIAAGGPMRYMPEESFRAVIEVNVIGVWRTLRLALPHVIERRGYMLPVASMAAIVAQFPGFAPYSTSKAGVEAMTKGIRVEVAHLGVDVGVAYFGWIDTDMVRGGEEHPAFTFMRQRLRGPLGKTLPVSKAGEAIANGIERRAKTIAEPPFVRVVDKLRGLLTNAVDREIGRHVPEVMAHFEAERQRPGDAMAKPVGAGGRAATAARSEGTSAPDARAAGEPQRS